MTKTRERPPSTTTLACTTSPSRQMLQGGPRPEHSVLQLYCC